MLVLILDFGKALVTIKFSAPSQKNQTLQEITILQGHSSLNLRFLSTYLIIFDISFLQPKAIISSPLAVQ